MSSGGPILIAGRILVREDSAVGLYIPMGKNLKAGIYDVHDIFGELNLVYKGEGVGNKKRLGALTPSEILNERTSYLLTKEEYNELFPEDYQE